MAEAVLTIAKWALIGVLIAAILGFVAFIVWGVGQIVPQLQAVLDAFDALIPSGFKVVLWAMLAAITLPFAYKVAMKLISLF